jgi:hypothetical protein
VAEFSQKLSDLTLLIDEHASGRFENTINMAVPTLRRKVLEEEQIEGREWTRELFGGARSSTTIARDYGRRPRGGSIQPVKARELPVIITNTMALGLAASLAKLSDEETSSHVDAVLEEHSTDNARVLGRAIFGGGVNPFAAAVWDTALPNGTVDVTFEDISIFKPGASYDFIDVSAAKSYVVRATVVTPGAIGANSENVAGTVTFVNDVPEPESNAVVALEDIDVATGDSFQLRGTAAGFGGSTTLDGELNSFDAMAGSGATATLHGVTLASLANWKGWYRNHAAPYNQEAVTSFLMFIATQSGEMPTDVIMSPQLGIAHAASGGLHGPAFGVPALSLSAARPQTLDRSMDKYGMFDEGYDDDGLRAAGKKVTLDPNCQATRLIAHNRRRTKLGCWQKMGPEKEGSTSLFRNRDTLSLEAFITGMYKMVTTKRSTMGVMYGFTNI